MMATEATATKPVDVSVNEPSLTHSAATTKTDAQHVNTPGTTVNGSLDEIENKQITDIVDELVNSAEVSVSGGSDTEAYKADPLKSTDDKGHVRTSSTTTRPKSFKSVSVNKTFLAAKGAANAASRPESAAGSASSTPAPGSAGSSASRLKLVAKSGSNLGGSTKTLSTNGKSAAAPDGSSVWNRNKCESPPAELPHHALSARFPLINQVAAPTPEPKKLSDEELMNQLNIHIADRLRPEDDAKGQSNWADMEDEEEWAPETITWTDGTQITLPHADEHPPNPAPAPAPALAPAPAPAPAPTPAAISKEPDVQPKPKSPAPTATSTSATASPSVRPGVLASGKGLVLKGAPEKPTLVAKPPPPPAPVKSPWAPLPPIDKASPAIVMELPAHTHPSRGAQRDVASTKSMTPPPTKEIAADDFSRTTWREGPNNSSRELFNSQSGRYEPVFDRRGSRHEMPPRQPSVLQRPSHHDHQGPAEPSAAFQTGRISGQEGPYGRRRGSSNVSGGSGSMAHRMGRSHEVPPPEVLQARTGSFAGGTDSPNSSRPFSPANNYPTPRSHYSQPWQPRPSPNQNHASIHHPQATVDGGLVSPVNPPAVSTDEDTIELQKKIMRERREAARKRRVEEEEREEAAKKERLRLKLEALGPAPERKSNKKEESKEDAPKAYQPPQRENIPASLAARTTMSPQKPDAPATSSVEKEQEGKAEAKMTAEAQVNGGSQSSYSQARSQGAATQASALPKAQPAASWPEAPQSQKPAPYWGSNPQNTPRNVWGAPGNDRSLGNGTFSAGPLADPHHAPISAAPRHPAPIGTPRHTSQVQHSHAEPPSSRLAPIGPPRGRPAPPSRGEQQMASNPWKSADIAADDHAINLEVRARNEAQMKQFADQGLGVDAMGPSTVDTWREVRRNEDGKRVHVGSSVKSYSNAPSRGDQRNASWNGPAVSEKEDAPHAMPNGVGPDYSRQPPVGPSGVTMPTPASQTRGGSRFFPSSKGAPHEDPTSQQPLQQQSRTQSPSPPPPTMEDHPVYSGNPERPHVALPPPRPQVKLPPSIAISEQPAPAPVAPPQRIAPISFAAAAAAAAAPVPHNVSSQTTAMRPPSRGLHGHPQSPHEYASQQKWQDKINHLMGKDSAPPARSMAVEVASRHTLEHMPSNANGSATVSLPSLSTSSSTASDDSRSTSRGMAEECFEEQEMGSLPPVHLPNEAPDALWHAASVNWQPLAQRYRVEASNAEEHRFGPDWANGKTVIRIATPGSDPRTLPFSLRNSMNNRTKSNPRRPPQRGGGRHSSRGGHRGGREMSDHHGEHPSGPSSDRPTSNRSNRSSFRGRSDNWGRHTSSASTVQT
ncbi:hypothetical protein DL763_008245 [Monosporascus cannonballus]|nr:hypothetical protein DL763_008245 [Monosporascus cannonballus]